MPIGRFTKKIQCQLIDCVSTPPASRPTEPPAEATNANTPIAFACSRGSGNIVTIIPRITAEVIAPPTPCTKRAATSTTRLWASAAQQRGAREQRDAREEDAPAADQVAEAAGQQQQAAERDQVGVDDPREARRREDADRPGSTAARRSRSSRRGRSSASPRTARRAPASARSRRRAGARRHRRSSVVAVVALMRRAPCASASPSLSSSSLRAVLARSRRVLAVQEHALLGVAQPRPGAVREQLDGRHRDRHPLPVAVHVVGVDDPLVARRCPRRARRTCRRAPSDRATVEALAAALAEVELVPAVAGRAEPPALGVQVRPGGEHARGGAS